MEREMPQIIELEDKNFKAGMRTILHMFQKIEESMHLRSDMEDIKKI